MKSVELKRTREGPTDVDRRSTRSADLLRPKLVGSASLARLLGRDRISESDAKEARDRLRKILAGFMVLVSFGLLVAHPLSYAAGVFPWWIFLLDGVGVGALAGIYLALRSDRVSDRAAMRLGVLVQCIGCAAAGAVGSYAIRQGLGADAIFTPFGLLLITFSVLVPSSVRMAIFTTALACLAGAAAKIAVHAYFVGLEQPKRVLLLLVEPTMAFALSVIVIRAIAKVRQVAEAARDLGAYRLERKIGGGGMGEVWIGHHRMLARPAAIKLIAQEPGEEGGESDGSQHAKAVARFQREARATASLTSVHTVELYDFGVTDDRSFYYAMELLEGEDLRALVEREGPLPPSRAVHLLLQACDSLAEAHEAGLIHRDIKPANLFLCRRGGRYDFLKVLDFGLVAVQKPDIEQEEARLTGEGILGTPSAMAPEAISGGKIDPRADLYGLGCVAYWMLTGHEVFERGSVLGLLVAHSGEAPTPPSERLASDRQGEPLPAALEALVLACLEKDPARRPQSASELAARLRAVPLPEPWTEEDARRAWATPRDADHALALEPTLPG